MYANLYHDLCSSPSDITLKDYVEVKLSNFKSKNSTSYNVTDLICDDCF